MDYQQSDKNSEKISEILKSVYDWLEKTDKSKKYNQQSYKNSEKISDIGKRIDKWLEKTDKSSKKIPELNSGLRFPIMQLEGALDKIVKKVQEATNLPEIRIYDARVDLIFSKQDYGGLHCESHYN